MSSPLADRIRPSSIDEIVGQEHLLGEGRALRSIIMSGKIPNLIFYGPSGTGKTTLAGIIAEKTDRALFRLNATTASLADIKDIVSRLDTLLAPNGILLYLDEIQYFNKKQQQSLLEYLEDGRITLIASTTENPYFYIYNALLSRCSVFEFKEVEPKEAEKAILRAFRLLSEENNTVYDLEEGLSLMLARSCGGDLRKAVNAAELCVLAASAGSKPGKKVKITARLASELSENSALRYDRNGDEHFDIISAFQKSLRGSDPDAALHYLARLLEAGDLKSAVRRLLVCTCEDVGLAYPQLIPVVKAACDIALQVGLPEAQIPLADAVVAVSTAPKSNSAYLAMQKALSDVKKGDCGPVPRQLQNRHFDGEDCEKKGQFYKYPHDFEGHWCKQQYLPTEIADRTYYLYSDNKNEQAAKAYWEKIKK